MSLVGSSPLCIRTMEDTAGWDAFVQSHSCGSIFHTTEMIRAFDATPQFKPLALAACQPDGSVAGILVATQVCTMGALPNRLSSRSVFFAGPLGIEGPMGTKAVKSLLAHHDDQVGNKVVFSEIRPCSATEATNPLYLDSGYEPHDYINYEIDLRQTPDQIFRGMSHQRRNNIRANERRGLTVREGDPDTDLSHLYAHLTESFTRSKIPLVEREHFEHVFGLLPRSRYRLTIAEVHGKPVASSLHLIFKDRVYWWHAGTKRIQGITAQASLVWDAIQWGIDQNAKVYDFAGAGWEGEIYTPGVFKSRFGGQRVNVRRYRKVYSRLRMNIASAGYRLARPIFSAPRRDRDELRTAFNPS
ncbi:lipid II:glycine glycyltransferase FemX [Neorhodopirellula lusitana]|uniref:lipid II:glycine glycyltransferase FemX n=1 Tax=Neorhodopirellula lusitana TaxID=445327 RepID=UPI003850BFB3